VGEDKEIPTSNGMEFERARFLSKSSFQGPHSRLSGAAQPDKNVKNRLVLERKGVIFSAGLCIQVLFKFPYIQTSATL
jgi:hypothetical protein